MYCSCWGWLVSGWLAYGAGVPVNVRRFIPAIVAIIVVVFDFADVVVRAGNGNTPIASENVEEDVPSYFRSLEEGEVSEHFFLS